MPRITNRERVLLALEDANEYADRYEVPRRFSQSGLAPHLGISGSLLSRVERGEKSLSPEIAQP